MENIHKNIEECNPNKNQKIDHVIFDYVIPDKISNKKLNPIATDLFIRRRKLKIL